MERSQHLNGVLLYPSQPQAADAALAQNSDEPPPDIFDDPEFALDAEAYRSDKNFPEKWVDVTPMGRMRDLDIVQLSVAAGQYRIAAGTDSNNDNFLCDAGEACGFYRTLDSPDTIVVNSDQTDLDFTSGFRVNLFTHDAATTAAPIRLPAQR